MQNITSNQREHLQNGGTLGVTITVDPVDSAQFTLTEDDIIAGSFSIDKNWTQGSTIEIGCADTAELSFELDNTDGQWNSIRWEGAQLTVVYDIAGEPLQAGIFTVDERPARLTTMQIRALDHMARFNRPYVSGVSFPATLLQILQDVCAQCNVSLYTLTFDNDSYIVDEAPEGEDITCHHVVAWVAELAGCNAWIDQLARLQLSWYGEDQPASPPITLGPNDRFSYELAERDITITGIIYRTQDIDYVAGTNEYALIIEDNPLLQEDYESILAALYNKLGGFSYRPYEFSSLGYPHLWPGDAVNELTDADGNIISSIITNHVYTLNGNSELSAKGETETVRGYATGAPFTATQKRVLETVAAIEAEREASSVEQATLELNQLMANSLGYYTTNIEQPSGAKVTYTHDQPTLENSTYIWTQTEQGFAWTDQGWNGGNPTWQYGVTTDGNMVLRTLEVRGLNADWITTGTISAGIVFAGSVSGITGDFEELWAGDTQGAHLNLGQEGGFPFINIYDANELRVEFKEDRVNFYKDGILGGEIFADTWTSDARRLFLASPGHINLASGETDRSGIGIYPDYIDFWTWPSGGVSTQLQLHPGSLNFTGRMEAQDGLTVNDSSFDADTAGIVLSRPGYAQQYRLHMGYGEFNITSNTSGYTAFHMDQNGNIGIGMRPNSTYKMVVNGTFWALSHMWSDGNVWCDGYVRGDGGFRVGTNVGMTTNVLAARTAGGYYTLYFVSGILTNVTIHS